ncbi:hypothetical protein [Lactobacillus xylocopicola]|uniref:Tropomyosin n=1 Tax=Lactobacillus xylocopicola TaxID=2976676 RepID=A0ABN6SK74_9LACO|nr:hypothetical protein [Lactobacillus xylocopicola]BDR60757.1 hypothetical protein KIM322_10180 [Lactobacillus xylocopicola]
MKEFSLGLAVGAATGIILALVKDKNGHRLGQPIQAQFEAAKTDAGDLTAAVHKLQAAEQEFDQALPKVQKTMFELENELDYYQTSTARLVNKMQHQAELIDQHARAPHKEID